MTKKGLTGITAILCLLFTVQSFATENFWVKEFHLNSDYSAIKATSVLHIDGGGKIVTGSSSGYGQEGIFAIKFLPSGAIDWQKRYGNVNSLTSSDCVKNGSNFLLVGQGTNYKGFSFEIDSDGNVVSNSAKRFTGIDNIHNIKRTSDGGYLISGKEGYNPGKLVVAKLTAQFGIDWTTKITTLGNPTGEMSWACEVPGCGYYITMLGSGVVKLDYDGDVIWNKIYSTTSGVVRARAIYPTSDGNIALVGQHSIGYSHNPCVLRIDPDVVTISPLHRTSFLKGGDFQAITQNTAGDLFLAGKVSMDNTPYSSVFVAKATWAGVTQKVKRFGDTRYAGPPVDIQSGSENILLSGSVRNNTLKDGVLLAKLTEALTVNYLCGAGIDETFTVSEHAVTTATYDLVANQAVTRDDITILSSSISANTLTLSAANSCEAEHPRLTVELDTTKGFVVGTELYVNPVNLTINCSEEESDCSEVIESLTTATELTAHSKPGYFFSHWEVNGTYESDSNPVHVYVFSDVTWTAIFEDVQAHDFIFPVLKKGQTDPLLNKDDPLYDDIQIPANDGGWWGSGVGEQCLRAGHLGQDYTKDANNGITAGESVYAVANGTIVSVANNQNTSYGWPDNGSHGWGPVVVIEHIKLSGFNTSNSIVQPDDCNTETSPTVVYSLYGHLSQTSIASLYVGMKVFMGDSIGVLGSPNDDWEVSLNMGSHLHFEIKDQAGFDEGSWYRSYPGECPGSISQAILGVGTGYSYETGFSPHRYKPDAFIQNNQQ